MPQFLEQRYGRNVRVLMAIFWLGVYVFVNLTAILWLGSIAIKAIAGITQMQAIVAVGLFALAYQLYGGLKAVALTDIVQVSLLLLGGVVICSLSLNAISGGNGVIRGLRFLIDHYPDKFQMILPKSSPHYAELPGVAVLFGGMWVMNLSYFGFNQYIIQRALAAKSLKDAQTGIALSACLKLLMPMVVVLPGIAALALVPRLIRPDQAYAEMMKLLPAGFKGLVFAALIAAIVSSLASKINSISTIFTLDIYVHMRKDSTQSHRVFVGRVTAIIAVLIAIVTAPMLLGSFDQGFQFIQEFTGFFTPGIVVIFLLGMFWPRTTTAAAFLAATGSAAFSLVFKLFYPTVPFMNRVGLIFLITLALAIAVSLLWPTRQSISTLSFGGVSYKTSKGFNAVAVGLIVVLTAIYALLW
jgi:SSS family solute:Na+ symporter